MSEKLNHTAYSNEDEEVFSKVPIHPGEILNEEIEARGLKKKFIADKMGVPPGNLSDLLHGRRNVSPEWSLKIEQVIGIDAEFWLRAQARYDLTIVRNRQKEEGN